LIAPLLALLGLVLLGGPSPASAAARARRAVPVYAAKHRLPVYGLPSEAGYLSERFSTRASTVLTVPRIDCSGVAPGGAAGQSYGITFSGRLGAGTTPGPPAWTAVVVRTVCKGRLADYEAFFIRAGGVSSAGATGASPAATEVYSPAPLAVRPGQEIALRASLTSTRSTLSITNLHTHQRASTGGAAITDARTSIRVSTVTANGRGGVLESATLRQSSNPATVPGPVAAGPALFAGTRIDGKPLLKLHGLALELWVSRRSRASKAARILALPIATKAPAGGFAIVIAAAR
jgi:hypothetical protein